MASALLIRREKSATGFGDFVYGFAGPAHVYRERPAPRLTVSVSAGPRARGDILPAGLLSNHDRCEDKELCCLLHLK